jgi:hypothetical protein
MKKIMTMAAVSALAIAAPAAAQSLSTDMDVRIDRLQTEITANARSGLITRAEAQQLREELRTVRRIERQYSVDGLSWSERRDLDVRLRNLDARVDYAERSRGMRYGRSDMIDRNRDGWDDRDYDRDGRWDDNVRFGSSGMIDRNRDGWDDRDYDRDGRWDDNVRFGSTGMVDRNRDGWDDRDYDRDGRWDDNVRSRGYATGMGGPYNEIDRVCVNRGVVGIIGSLLGQDNCLTVGERVSGNLSGLPYNLRGQFPDGRGYYHRYLNGDVVQIDARTGTVVRIYDVY